VALVAYSFGGLVLKSLVVEARKHLNQQRKNDLDDEVHKCCNTFLNNVKGVIFYGVPHAGGTEYLSNYFHLATSTNQHIEQVCNPIWFF
jgi:triacylglycerol esterase/lipase EstA (alpha/beta hydrolase family)